MGLIALNPYFVVLKRTSTIRGKKKLRGSSLVCTSRLLKIHSFRKIHDYGRLWNEEMKIKAQSSNYAKKKATFLIYFQQRRTQSSKTLKSNH